MVTVVVKWKGPYSMERLREIDESNGIYLITGKLPRQRLDRIQYCGITEGLFRVRICLKDHKCEQIRSETLGVWLGELVYPDAITRSILEVAEHCFIAFWQPDFNQRKNVYCPYQKVCLISQWFKVIGTPRTARPEIIRDLPDALWWDEERWRTGQLNVAEPTP